MLISDPECLSESAAIRWLLHDQYYSLTRNWLDMLHKAAAPRHATVLWLEYFAGHFATPDGEYALHDALRTNKTGTKKTGDPRLSQAERCAAALGGRRWQETCSARLEPLGGNMRDLGTREASSVSIPRPRTVQSAEHGTHHPP